jgi:hypothetical protein
MDPRFIDLDTDLKQKYSPFHAPAVEPRENECKFVLAQDSVGVTRRNLLTLKRL